MATIGEQIKEPEAGWRRYDDTHPGLKYTGTWTTPSPTNTAYYGGSIRVTSRAVDNNYVTFSFFGTKLRIISDFYSDRHSDNAITIDGVTETYSAFRAAGTSSLQQAIVYEKLGLTLGFHTVSIATGHNRINFTLDAIDIDETGYLSGYALTAPESGWKRIDDSSPQVSVSGNIARNTTDSNFHNTSAIFIQDATGQINFKFYGTKFRLIGAKNTNRSTNIEVFINDVKDTSFSQNGTLLYKSMDYEKSGLSLGVNVITIKGNGVYGLDAIDIDDTGYLLAQVGQQLISPEAGWIRYDDNTSSIKYVGSFTNGVGAGAYNGYSNYTSTIGDRIVFDFEGTKLRLIGARYTNRSDLIEVYVNGKLHETHSQLGSELAQVLQVEIVGLPKARHRIEMVNKSSGSTTTFMALDAIDIDSDGRLFHPDEVTNVADLEIGKRIRCNYSATASGKAGVFGNLGKETSNMGSTPTSISNVDFYFIMADEYNNKKILVADRNIQSSISWDSLNSEGLISGVQINLNDERCKFVSRVMSGGYASGDTYNEWDRYIVNSTLNGKVIAGDNNVWNWSGTPSLTSTTNATSANRVRRGGTSVALFGASRSDTANSYRPLMEVEILPLQRSVILINGAYKKYQTESSVWSTISTTLPSENTFINEGMGDLSVLDRKSTSVVQNMIDTGNLGSGKVYKSTVDLKKYIEITNLSVK